MGVVVGFFVPMEVSSGEGERRVVGGFGHDGPHLGKQENREKRRLLTKEGVRVNMYKGEE